MAETSKLIKKLKKEGLLKAFHKNITDTRDKQQGVPDPPIG